MQRKTTAQSRGANALEKEHMSWLKEREKCSACGAAGDVICHHMYGSAAKKKVGFETVLIGHAAVLALCEWCDNIVTHGSRRAFTNTYGPQSKLWAEQEKEWDKSFPEEVQMGIMAFESGGRHPADGSE